MVEVLHLLQIENIAASGPENYQLLDVKESQLLLLKNLSYKLYNF